MTMVKTRIRVTPDGMLSGRAPGFPAGEHDAEITLLDDGEPVTNPPAETLLARVRAIQEEVARLPVLDARDPDEIIGYNKRGHFD
ncbi:MAG TPA: hypothetical protein VGM07_05520 [Stellaceae bacterium]